MSYNPTAASGQGVNSKLLLKMAAALPVTRERLSEKRLDRRKPLLYDNLRALLRLATRLVAGHIQQATVGASGR
jgi:hypothetical protein